MSLECWQDAANDYEKLLEIDKGHDVIIYAGENDVKELHAFSIILCIRSQYFHDELNKEKVEKREGKFVLRLPKIPPHLFKTILR